MTQRPSQFPRWVFPLLPFVTIAGVGGLGTILALPSLAMSRFSMQRPYLVDSRRLSCSSSRSGRP